MLELRAADQRLRIARQENIRAQQEASRELLRNLAHEIKNPLGGIRGAAQLLEHELPRESLREYTQVIIKEADRLQSLMERLLTPHRLPKLSAVNIHEVLERVRSLLLAETPHGIRIRRDYDVSLPEIRADAEQLIQAVLNIARNAVQAMIGKGELEFRTRAARQVTLNNKRHRLALRLDIIDNGPRHSGGAARAGVLSAGERARRRQRPRPAAGADPGDAEQRRDRIRFTSRPHGFLPLFPD